MIPYAIKIDKYIIFQLVFVIEHCKNTDDNESNGRNFINHLLELMGFQYR